jgi:hypothetical protein
MYRSRQAQWQGIEQLSLCKLTMPHQIKKLIKVQLRKTFSILKKSTRNYAVSTTIEMSESSQQSSITVKRCRA